MSEMKQPWDYHQEFLPGVTAHSIGHGWRTNPPVYDGSDKWKHECMRAIIDSLTSEGVAAWPRDATSCVLQIVEAFAKREAELLKKI